jgi:hypothetical protein
LKTKRIELQTAMTALSKFLVLLALSLLASHANALSSIAGNQVLVIHLIQLRQPMSNPKNDPSHEPICKPTKQMDLDAMLSNDLSTKNKRETCSDDLDYDIHNKIPVECNSRLNKWQMPDKISLDSSGL